ncbi:MAG: winged helix DNA-binding protein [Janthinobacterium lividum]
MATRKRSAAPDAGEDIVTARSLLQHSHLAPTSAEDNFVEFEFALHHITEAFARWSSALHEYVSGELLPVHDISVLQTIRMNERAKSAAEIGKFLNRDDGSNILYALRKLDKAGLIRKSGGPSRQTTYQVTERGRDLTDHYAALRKEILLESIGRLSGSTDELARVTAGIWQVSGLYEQAARKMAMMQMLQPKVEHEAVKPTRGPRRGRPQVIAS